MDAEDQRGQRADRLRERSYVTFTALAVVLVLRSEAEHMTARVAAGTLAVTVVATLLAVLVADVVREARRSHVVVILAVIPWGYVVRQYLTAPGDRWR